MQKVHKFVVHNFVNFCFYSYLCVKTQQDMEKAFIFGVSVSGENFTDRIEESKRIRMNFENGLNTILISPRRIGKTSLVNKVCDSLAKKQENIHTVRMDIYDCRNEYDFYNKFAATILKSTSTKIEQVAETAREFLGRIVPKISISPDPSTEYSISLGIRPKDISPEEILSLPEKIAEKKNMHIVICIDEFQQIGDFPDSVSVQKRLRGVWQHQHHTSYCLYGSKKHMMEKLFQNKRMPFYMFGDTMYLKNIQTEDWIPFICNRFGTKGKKISESLAAEICRTVENHSSYVQQLAWNVMIEAEREATAQNLKDAVQKLVAQCSPLFIQQTESLSSYQMNFLKAISSGIHSGFSRQSIMENYNLGSKSNISRLTKSLIDKELIDKTKDGIFLTDPVFRLWIQSEYPL